MASTSWARPATSPSAPTWEQVAAAQPDVLVLLPCGMSLADNVGQARELLDLDALRATPAVANGTVWAVDANAWSSRPGPRLLDGIEALASILAEPTAPSGPAGTQRLLLDV